MPEITILLHSSKTMRPAPLGEVPFRRPQLFDKAERLGKYLKTLSIPELAKSMKLSPALAKKTHTLIDEWTTESSKQSLAIDSFVGDIYSGLRALELSVTDRNYADKTLQILSGLYGTTRPYDAICPYRLEMGYTFPNPEFSNLYDYWGDSIASCISKQSLVINLASEEFSKTITPFFHEANIVAPRFLTINPKTSASKNSNGMPLKRREPKFVAVHAKIARGAFARWLITSRVNTAPAFTGFSDLGYRFNKKLSSSKSPTFVCDTFGGKGLSIK